MPKTIISAEPDTLGVYLKKVWQHHALIVTLAKRDLKIKYAQTVLGLAWTFIQPLVAVITYTLFFAYLMDFKTEYPYILFVLSGILLWGLFNYIFAQGSTSLTQNQELIRKLYFPKIILPLSKALVGFVEFVIIAVLFIILMFVFQSTPTWRIIFIPFLLIALSAFALGMAFILSAATVRNRDLNHIIPFLVNFGIWFTPVFYPVTLIPQQFAHLLYINPMASIIQLFRVCVFGEAYIPAMFLGIAVSFLIFILGFFYLKNVEDSIVDYL